LKIHLAPRIYQNRLANSERMKFCLLSFLLLVETSLAFVSPSKISVAPKTSLITSSTAIRSSLKEDETKTKVDAAVEQNGQAETDPDSGGLPWWWELVWKLDIMKKGEEGTDTIFGDSANVLRTNIEQIYGGYPSLDGCPLAEGELGDIADGTMFIGLQNYYENYGSPYKLCFGPKSFLVISDPIQAKHLLRDAGKSYYKVSKDFSNLDNIYESPLYLDCRIH
jgi:hypothetical protein